MKLNRLIACVMAATLFASNFAFAQNSPTTTPSSAQAGGATLPEIKFTEYKLKNGLRVILHEDRSVPIVGVNLWYHVGSKDEVPGRTGFAHLFEHMMFQGSKGYDDDFFKPIQEAGGTLNGSTNPDRTNYWEVVPSNFLELALFMEADRMGGLLDVLNEAKLANQRDVVKNEKRQNYDNRPYGLVGARISEILYPENHPYHWLTIGSLDDLTNASLDDVKGFFRRYYTPNNASLAIAGDFDPQQARGWIEKYFGPIESGPAVPKVNYAQPRLNGERREEMQDRVALARLYMVWHSMPQYTPDEASADTLATILGGGKSSRLYKALVYDRRIAQDVSAFNGSGELAGTFRITATAKQGTSLADLEKAIGEEIERLKKESPTAEELSRAYNAREAAFVYSLQTVGGFGGRNDQLNQYATYLGQPGYFQQDLARYSRVTADDVKRIANQYLTNNRLIVNVTPRAAQGGQRRTAAGGATTGDPAPTSPAQAATRPAQQTAEGAAT
nr:insulinase family protein [Pyrinomonadaceae bacterium]